MTTQNDQAALRDTLRNRRQELQSEIDYLSGGGVKGDVFLSDETDAVDQHPADDASELFEREKNLALQRTLEVSLQEVDAAIERLENGTYGICENCGKPIAPKRLEARPEAAYCIDCQAKLAGQQQANRV